MMMPGEQEQIDTVLRIAADIGYGNLICRLQEAWGKMLHDKYGIGDGSPHKWAGHASEDAKLPPPGHILTDDGTVRKVLGKLFTTSEGDVVGEGGRIYFINARDNVCEWESHGAGDLVPIEMWYSTREAAEAARAKP